MRLQFLLYTIFATKMCNRINSLYSKLAKQMEYEADDVAAQHIGQSMLQRTIVHAACIKYNYEAMQWGMKQLGNDDIQIDNPYLALNLIGVYSHPSKNMFYKDIIHRVERLGELQQHTASIHSEKIRIASSSHWNYSMSKKICNATYFAQWLKGGLCIYAKQKQMAVSVRLIIHLDEKKYKHPYIDGNYTIMLDGKSIGIGNYIKGYDLYIRTSPGQHTITACAPAGVNSEPYIFETEEGKRYQINMDYRALKGGTYDIFAAGIEELL